MRPAEEGLLLLCCALGTQDVPLTPAQYRTLARRVRQTRQAGDGEVTPAYLRALGYPEGGRRAGVDGAAGPDGHAAPAISRPLPRRASRS